MEKRTIILINDTKQYPVDDINRLKLDDIRKFIKREFNIEEDFIYLYDNNLRKNIFQPKDLLRIKEEDYEHNLCLIKIRFKTRNDINNNDNNNYNNNGYNNLSRTMALNKEQIKKAYYGIEKDTNNNNIQMRDSNKMNRYKNNFTNSGKNQNYNISKNSNKYINNIKIANNKYAINNNNFQSIKNNNPNLINQKVNNNIPINTNIIYNNANNTSNKNVNNRIVSNKNINNNVSNTSNKNINNYINKASNQSINSNTNNSNKKSNDTNKNNNIIKKESNNITESDNNINSNSNKKISDISKNSSNMNINDSSKENSIKLSNKKMKRINLNLNKPSKELLGKKNLLKEISGDIDEDKQNKEELEKYKEELKKEIENLEKELSDLKKENEDIIKEGDIDEDIIIDEKTIDKLKQDIINEVSSKIENEFKNKIRDGLNKMNEINIKNHEKQINSKFEEIKKEYNDKIENEIKNLKLEQLKNINENKNNILHNIDNNIADSSINRIKKKQIFNREKGQNNANIKNFPENNLDQNINYKINYGKNNIGYNNNKYNKFLIGNKNNNNLNNIIGDGQENIEDDDNNYNNNYERINSFKKPNVNPNMDRKTGYNKQGSGIYLKEDQKKSNDNLKKIPFQSKKSKEFNLLNTLTYIFFTNQQQTEINTRKINEYYLERIRKEYYNHISEPKNIVYIYVNNFIKNNVLKLFKKDDIHKEVLEIVKTKISSLLECINMRKDYYEPYYFPQIKKDKVKNRQSSVLAAERFRKEFNISEKDINQDVLVDTLYENNNDIYQVFGLIYGK